MCSSLSTWLKNSVKMVPWVVGFVIAILQSSAYSQGELDKALSFKPSQADVDYDIPTGDRLAGCKVVSATKFYGVPGYVVHDGSGQVLRLFLDRNKDRALDQWSYFRDGIEVYRDSDNNFNSQLDEFRWMGTAGSRVGIDKNEDRVIDAWENISVEEVVKEAFMSIRDRDQKRFNRLLISSAELQGLGLSGKVGTEVTQRLQAARSQFSSKARSQRQITKASRFVHSGNGQPGLAVVSKIDGISKDIVCYDHASAVFENGGEFGNLALGTVVKVGNNWRLLELPEIVDPKQPIGNGGCLFPMQMIDVNDGLANGGVQLNAELVELYQKLDQSDKALAALEAEGNLKRNAVRIANLHKEKALLGIEIFKNVPAAERLSWLQNVTDNVADAYREEEFPRGLSFLEDFSRKLAQEKIRDGLDYIRWRSIYAQYSLTLKTAPARERQRALETLQDELEKFHRDFPRSEFAPEALHQLGQNNEVEANADQAAKWYGLLARNYPRTLLGQRGQGALTRIQGKGKRIRFSGKTAQGKTFDLSSPSVRGKIVVLHFWDSDSTSGFDDLRKINAKYADEVIVVGANIDSKTEDFEAFMRKNRNVNWPQLHAPGGMEKSPLAVQIGLVAQPMAMIFNKKGELVEDNISFGDLEREIQRLLR